MTTPLRLTPVEARVIASLAEKAIATPQYYPMTVNAIMLAANQKSSRDPVMQLREGEVGAALEVVLGAVRDVCTRDHNRAALRLRGSNHLEGGLAHAEQAHLGEIVEVVLEQHSHVRPRILEHDSPLVR